MAGTNSYEESTCIQQIAEGDEEAFSRLFYHYGAIIHPVILKIVKDETAAEDVVAEVFLKLWLHRSRLPEVGNLAGYIYRMATNFAINSLKQHKTAPGALQDAYLDLPGQEPSAEDQFTIRELKQSIHKAVETLPEQRRRIYELSREKGLSRQEIAETLQISENTVKNQLRIALRHIQESILKDRGLLIAGVFFLQLAAD
ncbi:RNA polymerase sigma-70 factor [Chitinophaga caseinilytica]|uniref:RNA polymerase sigma-70 factor n=1 Tax=Chitinophaga caseinilytica TaxID=2267521 RepID=A0ABZ2Z0P1_9BACT